MLGQFVAMLAPSDEGAGVVTDEGVAHYYAYSVESVIKPGRDEICTVKYRRIVFGHDGSPQFGGME